MLRTNRIASFAVLDLETTGLPSRDFDKVNITEIAIHSIAAKNINNDSIDCDVPRIIHKLRLVFKPRVMIQKVAAEITGLTNSILSDESSFDENAANVIVGFLKHLKQPVCLVAHNGNRFDFPILKHALDKIGVQLPSDILCIDTLIATKVLDTSPERKVSILSGSPGNHGSNQIEAKDEEVIEAQVVDTQKQTKSYKLECIYIRCFGEAPDRGHHAEADVESLQRILLHYGKSFVNYSEAKAKLFKDI